MTRPIGGDNGPPPIQKVEVGSGDSPLQQSFNNLWTIAQPPFDSGSFLVDLSSFESQLTATQKKTVQPTLNALTNDANMDNSTQAITDLKTLARDLGLTVPR